MHGSSDVFTTDFWMTKITGNTILGEKTGKNSELLLSCAETEMAEGLLNFIGYNVGFLTVIHKHF